MCLHPPSDLPKPPQALQTHGLLLTCTFSLALLAENQDEIDLPKWPWVNTNGTIVG